MPIDPTKKTAMIAAITALQTTLATAGTQWATLLAAQKDANAPGGTVNFLGASFNSNAGVRLEDIVGVSNLSRLMTDCMLANGMRKILEAFAGQEGTGTADIAARVTTLLAAY